MEKCKICGKEFMSVGGLQLHVSQTHKLSSKEYYDSFLKKENEGFCRVCGKPTRFYSLSQGYAQYCCRKCSDSSVEKHRRASETWHRNNSAESVNEKVKKTKFERYGNENYNNSDKTRSTNIEKYGVDNVSKSADVKQKIRETKKDRYDDENYNNRDKARKTNLERYGSENPYLFGSEEFLNTLIDRYGVENISQLDEYKKKISKANRENAQERLEKIRQTCNEKYGKDYANQSEIVKDKIKSSNQEKRNVDYAFQAEEVKEKIRQTCVDRYGVEYYSQSEEFHRNKLTRYFYDNEIFDSSYELCFYKYNKDIDVSIERNTDCFTYVYEGQTHRYFPDFKVDGRYVEIKGAHFFSDGKMINPFDRSQDGLYDAKYHCMLDNGVEIITDGDRYVEAVLSQDSNFIEKCSLSRKVNLDSLEWKELSDASQRCIDISKKATGDVFYHRELKLWNEGDKDLHRFLFANRLKYLNKNPNELTDLEILRGLNISGKVRAFSHFNNVGFKEFIQKYSPTSIYDPCAGWGERLLTCAANDIRYLGVDINEQVVEGHHKIVKHYGLTKQNTVFGDSSKYINEEDFDTTFTCPPYWNEEIYTDAGAENLSYEDFLVWWKQVVLNSNTKLFAYQINQKYREDMNRVVESCGYRLIDEIPLTRKSSHFTRSKNGIDRKKEYESIQVFKKS